MHIATRTGDLSTTASMSEEGDRPSRHDHVGTFTSSQYPPEGIKEVKKSAFEITHVEDNENEDLETSQLHNKTIDDTPCSPDVLAASTPSKDLLSSNRDVMLSSSAMPIVSSNLGIASTNGPSHLPSAPGGRFRKVNDYSRERWKVSDSLEVEADEHSDISEPRSVVQKAMDGTSASSSPSTPRRNASVEVASSSNLSDARSDIQLDEGARNEGATLTEASIQSRRTSTELSQDDIISTDDNYENYNQETPSEANVKTDSESTSNLDISASNILASAETIKSEASSIIHFVASVGMENTKLKQQIESLRQQVERLKKENMELRNPAVQQSSSAVPS